MFNKMKVTKQRKTNVIKSSLSVTFNESFEFMVEEDNLQNCHFVIELRHNSIFMKKGKSSNDTLFEL